MSEKSWDDEDFEVPPPLPALKSTDDKWEGEDEGRVKDNWDDDEEEEKKKPVAQTAAPMPKKKSKRQIIEEKQAQKEAMLKAKRAELEKMQEEMTPEEKLAEKLRLQKIQEESDLQFAVDMMGIKEEDAKDVVNLKEADLSSAEGLEALGAAVIKKIRDTDRLEKKTYYVTFLETFCKDLCANLESDDLSKVTASLKALFNEKLKANKPVKGKKKAADKAKLHSIKKTNDDLVEQYNDFDDFDDFI
jgi:translation initiation factor 3 subunit J